MRILEVQSPLQRIELYRETGTGLVLVMDGMGQVYESDEHRYHECLAVVPMLFCNPRRVFVGGGGDGLAATRLLRFPGVEEIVVCDFDEAITRLAQEQPDLVRLNRGSLNDPRVRVENEDAFAHLERDESAYDLILCDFPDPLFEELNRLYSVEFYRLVHDHLSDDGVVVVQTRQTPICAQIIGATVEDVFEHRRFYRFRLHGFTIAAKRPLVRRNPVPEWTRYLDEAFVDVLFTFPKDEVALYDTADAPVNRAEGNLLVKAALLETYGREAVEVFPYHADFTAITLTAGFAAKLDERLPLLLTALHESARLVLLVDQALDDEEVGAVTERGYRPNGHLTTHLVFPIDARAAAAARALLAQHDDAPVAAIEACSCCPADDDAVGPLIIAAYESRSDPFLGVPGAAFDPTATGTFLVCRDPAGEPVGAFRMDSTIEGVSVDALPFGSTTDNATRQAIWSLVQYLYSLGVERLTVSAPDAPTREALAAIGRCFLTNFRVFLHPGDGDAREP